LPSMASKNSGPGRKSSSKNKGPVRHEGRTTGRYVNPVASGRVTPVATNETKESPRWYGAFVLGTLLLGVLTMVLNYAELLPGAASAWYLLVGIVLLFVGFGALVNYR